MQQLPSRDDGLIVFLWSSHLRSTTFEERSPVQGTVRASIVDLALLGKLLSALGSCRWHVGCARKQHPHIFFPLQSPELNMSRLVKEGGELVIPLLKMVHSTADVFGPLKGATGGALHIVELVQKFKSNHKEWIEFGEYAADMLVAVVYFLPQLKEQPDVLQNGMNTLNNVLVDICKEIETMQGQGWLKRVSKFLSDPEKIDGMKKKLEDASKLYLLENSTSTGINVLKLFSVMDAHLASIYDRLNEVADTIVERIEERSILKLLPYAEGASWGPDHTCLQNTRETILDDIWTWINNPDPKTPPIFWLSGVAGSGKSAIAHSVAQRCALPNNQSHLLLSCFFFTRDKPERNSRIISTIATDLLKTSKQFSAAIADAIEADRSLPSASISRQFEHLILDPSLLYPPEQPVVIVIDALDEGCDEELLKLLRTEFRKLPPQFRVFVTSRSERRINAYLSKSESILKRFIDIYAYDNSDDIALYSRHQFKEMASLLELKEGWPDQELLDDFTKKADGLFLWAATVSNFLRSIIDPEGELRKLLYDSRSSNLSPEDKMSELYSAILSRCNWQDRAFAEGYVMLVGAILAAKSPLSMRAWQSLYSNIRVKDIFLSVGSLLSGLIEDSTPVRILHQSFRDFSTFEHQPLLSTPHYYINISNHNGALALLCLKTLSEGLARGIQGLGFLDVNFETDDIPPIPIISVSEVLSYACCYWMDHSIDVDVPTPDMVNAIQRFFKNHLIEWMELSAASGRFQNLEKYWNWSKKIHMSADLASPSVIISPGCCLKIEYLSEYLSYVDRRYEALLAMEDVVVVRRTLAAENPEMLSTNLAMSLNTLSSRLSDLGQNERALETIQEAVTLSRELARQHPEKFSSELAGSLNNLSSRLSNLGRNEEGLETIQEAVTLYKELTRQHPNKFDSHLAMSFSNLSSRLSNVGCHEQALEMIQEAVTLYKELVHQNPKKYNPHLATSLNNFSSHLSDLGRYEQALEMMQEAVTLRRELARQYPKKFNPDLATSLNNLSVCLSDLGRREHALKLVQEALALRRELASQHPKTYNPDLASCLNNLSTHLSDLGRNEEALEIIQEAVTIRRELARQRPKKFKPDLATSLNNLSLRLSNLGRREHALDMILESVALHKELANQNPKKFNPDLASSLDNFSSCLSSLGRHESSLEAIQEAVSLRRELARIYPRKFNPHLATSLNNLSLRLHSLGHYEQALEMIQEAVILYKELTHQYPNKFSLDLAYSLDNLSACLSTVGRTEEALVVKREAKTAFDRSEEST